METEEEKKLKDKEPSSGSRLPAIFTPRIVGLLAEEIAKTMVTRLPNALMQPPKARKKPAKKTKKLEHALLLDTSAIIDGRIFDVIQLGLITGPVVAIESVLLELKHIADSQDMVRRERGRKGLLYLDSVKKIKGVRFSVVPDEIKSHDKELEVDERLIKTAKSLKGKIITCDYNLEKKAHIQNVQAINVNALANVLKVTAVPGEALHIKILHMGKDVTQGVGYLDDGTMIVVEQGSDAIDKTIDVVIARVIQTATGRILFAKKI